MHTSQKQIVSHLRSPLVRTRWERWRSVLGGSFAGFILLSGCTSTPGSRPSVWPNRTAGATSAAAGVTGSLASTTQAVKGQFTSMGTAVSSAYGKAKTAITSPFNATAPSGDPTSLATKPTVGPELHVMKGHLDESQGNYAKALDSYSKALELEPKNASALLSMARLYERQNEKDKAVEFYQKAGLSAPNDASIFADLGSLQARSGNLTAGRAELQKAVNLDPKSTSYRSALAGVLLDSGNSEAAMTELQQVNSPAMANYQMAYLHFTRKNVPVTQQYLASALQIDPNLKPARDLMASMGGAQNINQMAQRGQETMQRAQAITQQATAVGNNLQSLMGSVPPVYPAATASPKSTPNGQSFNAAVSSMPLYEQASTSAVPMNR